MQMSSLSLLSTMTSLISYFTPRNGIDVIVTRLQPSSNNMGKKNHTMETNQFHNFFLNQTTLPRKYEYMRRTVHSVYFNHITVIRSHWIAASALAFKVNGERQSGANRQQDGFREKESMMIEKYLHDVRGMLFEASRRRCGDKKKQRKPFDKSVKQVRKP